MGWDGMGWDGMGWDGVGWDGMGWDGMGWDGMGWIPPTLSVEKNCFTFSFAMAPLLFPSLGFEYTRRIRERRCVSFGCAHL